MKPLIGAVCVVTSLFALAASAVEAQPSAGISSPRHRVLCDRYLCANDKGVSRALTAKYRGRKAAARLYAQGNFDPTQFTLSNGVFCDVKERLCRTNRFYGTDGKRSGPVSKRYTSILFGK